MAAVGFGAESGPRRRVDYFLLITVLCIASLGVAAIFSATHGSPGGAESPRKQLIGIGLGLAAMVGLGLSDYSALLPRISPWAYALNLVFLVLVVVHGHSSHGAQRWIPLGPVQFQPSEFAKFALIISLALFLYNRRESIGEWQTLLSSIAFVAIPTALIFKQPDLGTALVIVSIWLGMVLIAGARWQHLAAVLAVGIGLFSIAWHTPLVKDYQKQRLTNFINPASDPRDTGYHLRQSEIAIGSGGVTGQGFLHGSQANGHFIPEQPTDFIFTIVGEEAGLVGACVLIGLYALLIQRCLFLLIQSEDMLGKLLIAGVVAMLSFHIIVNIGMTIGVMPVTGVPLPFFSYGLSALIVGMASVGLVASVGGRQRRMFD